MGTFDKYRRVVGSIGWPGNSRPGAAVIVGEDHIEDKDVGRRHLWVLDEVETPDLVELHNQCMLFEREHGPEQWFGNCMNPMVAFFEQRNRINEMRNRPWIYISGTIIPEESNPFKVAVEMITQRVHHDNKSLHFGNSSFLTSRLTEIEKEAAHTCRLEDYPAIAALGHAVCFLDLDQPIPARPVESVSAKGWT